MNDIPAFPKLPITRESNGEILYQSDGMTLRDYFAAKAMQGIVTDTGWMGNTVSTLAGMSYEVADAMMKEREA